MPLSKLDSRLLTLAAAGNVNKVQELLAQGAQVNAMHHRFGTPLHRAVQNGHASMVHALLAAGADPNVSVPPAWNPTLFHLMNPPIVWVRQGERTYHGVVSALVQHGAQIDVHGANGNTPLVAAAAAGNIPMVKHLLSLGANPNRCALAPTFHTLPGQPRGEVNGVSPLTHAMHGEHAQPLVDLLLAAGADPNAMDGGGNLPLYSAVSWRVPATVVQRLLDAGAVYPACPGIKDRNSFEETLATRGRSDVRALFEALTLRRTMDDLDDLPRMPPERARIRL